MQQVKHAIAPKHGNKIHGRDPFMMHNKKGTLSFLQLGLNKHGKSAIGKQVSDLVKLTQAWNFRSGSTLWSMKTISYRNLTWKSKAWHGATQRA